MNYDTIIVEMLSRIQALEEEVETLKQNYRMAEEKSAPFHKVTTADIRNYIEELKSSAREKGEDILVLKANDIHKSLKLKSRLPMVCNAMRQCMAHDDLILHETASGYSSTLKIGYKLSDNWGNILTVVQEEGHTKDLAPASSAAV